VSRVIRGRLGEDIFHSVLDIVRCSGEWLLWGETVLDVKNSVVGLLCDATTKEVIATVQAKDEAAAVEVQENWRRAAPLRASGSIDMGFNSALRVPRWDLKDVVWLRCEARTRDEPKQADNELEAEISEFKSEVGENPHDAKGGTFTILFSINNR
jgi:hypothetical protein